MGDCLRILGAVGFLPPLSWDSLVAQMVKSLPAMREIWLQSKGREDPLEKEIATHSSVLAWKIPWMEESGGLQSIGSPRVGHDRATSLSFLRRAGLLDPRLEGITCLFQVTYLVIVTVLSERTVC